MVRAALKPSRSLAALMGTAHSIAALSLIPLDLALTVKLMIAGVIVVSFAHSVWRRALLRGGQAIVAIEVLDREHARVQLRDGRICDARVLATTYVTAFLTVVNLHVSGCRRARHVLIVPDNMHSEEFRKMRVLLRWGRPENPRRI